MVNRSRVAGSVASSTWRVWLIGFVIATVGVTAVSAAWHAGHDADSDCVLCKFENEPLADRTGDHQVGRCYTPEPATPLCSSTLVLTDLEEQAPARAPPLS